MAGPTTCKGGFLSAPPPMAPKDLQSPDLHLASLPTAIASGIVFFSLTGPPAPIDVGSLPAYGGTVVTEIACNWKVCVEHLLAEHTPSANFTWAWPLLTVRRAGARRRSWSRSCRIPSCARASFTHVFGGAADDTHAGGRYHQARLRGRCRLDRAGGKPQPRAPWWMISIADWTRPTRRIVRSPAIELSAALAWQQDFRFA